jgi:hypothetical protein
MVVARSLASGATRAGRDMVRNRPGTVEVTIRAGHVTHANHYELCV